MVLFLNPTNNLGKIQWYKTTVWLGIFCSILCVNFIPIKFIKSISIGIFSFTFLYVVFISVTYFNSGYIQINNKSVSTQTHEWIKAAKPHNIPEKKYLFLNK